MSGSGTGTVTPDVVDTTTVVANNIIKRALRLIGVLGEGESQNSDQSADALFVWKEMYDTWSGDSTLPSVPNEATHTIVVGTRDYTIGPTGDIVRNRPTEILNLILRSPQGNVDYNVEPMTKDSYYAVALKDQTVRPRGYLFEQHFPDAKIRFDSNPDLAYTLYLYLLDKFTAPTNVTDELELPPGYMECITYNLAVRLSPEYGLQPRGDVFQRAEDLIEQIHTRYTKTPEMRSVLGGGRYDVYSDTFGRSQR